MSTSQPSVATSSPTSSSSPSPDSNASTLLFGFLVSALSIFAVFMTFAIVWNRLIARRHAIDAMLAMSSPLHLPSRLRRPKMWDVWVTPDNQSHSWLDLKPVAAHESGCPPCSTLATQTEQITPFWRRYIWNNLPPEITYLFHPMIPPAPTAPSDTDMSHIELSDGSDIQVSLLIAMPRAPQSSTRGARKSYELVFATTDIRYHDPIPSLER